jgi:hypothetical protein
MFFRPKCGDPSIAWGGKFGVRGWSLQAVIVATGALELNMRGQATRQRLHVQHTGSACARRLWPAVLSQTLTVTS